MKLNTAPVFIHFPAKGKPKKADTFEIHRYGYDAEVLSRFIAERTGIQFRVLRPPNYLMNILLLATLALMVGLAYIKRDNLEFLYQRNTWAGIVIAFILVMMSGQMWNQIRGAGFAHKDPRSGAVVSTSDHPVAGPSGCWTVQSPGRPVARPSDRHPVRILLSCLHKYLGVALLLQFLCRPLYKYTSLVIIRPLLLYI